MKDTMLGVEVNSDIKPPTPESEDSCDNQQEDMNMSSVSQSSNKGNDEQKPEDSDTVKQSRKEDCNKSMTEEKEIKMDSSINKLQDTKCNDDSDIESLTADSVDIDSNKDSSMRQTEHSDMSETDQSSDNNMDIDSSMQSDTAASLQQNMDNLHSCMSSSDTVDDMMDKSVCEELNYLHEGTSDEDEVDYKVPCCDINTVSDESCLKDNENDEDSCDCMHKVDDLDSCEATNMHNEQESRGTPTNIDALSPVQKSNDDICISSPVAIEVIEDAPDDMIKDPGGQLESGPADDVLQDPGGQDDPRESGDETKKKKVPTATLR